MSQVFLNIGCGNKKLPGFVNIDTVEGADLQVDVSKGLPFADNAINGIFSEHFIEHLSQTEAIAFFRECRRVLVPQGVLRIATPDLDQIISSYGSNWKNQSWIDDFHYEWLDNRCEMLNVSMRFWGHQWLYNQEELVRLATYAGLTFNDRWAIGDSKIPEFKNIEYRRDSLVVEFVKDRQPDFQNDPLVSILVPAYNPRYLDQCLQSAVDQIYKNVEIIVSDDSAGQEVETICAKYTIIDSRVRYLKNDVRLGSIANYMRLFSEASGQYVKFLNDDDFLHPLCISRMMKYLQSLPYVTLVTSHRQPIDSAGGLLPENGATLPPVQEDTIINGVSVANALLTTCVNFIGEPTTVLFRKEDLMNVKPNIFSFGGRPVTWNVDVAMWLNLLSKGDMVYIVETLSCFRSHDEQEQKQADAREKAVAAWQQLRFDGERMGFLGKTLNRNPQG